MAAFAHAPRLLEDGCRLFVGAVTKNLADIERTLTLVATDQAGVRLRNVPGLRDLLAAFGPVGAVAASILGPDCQPVRAIFFDKSAASNWALPWHQDRTIAVTERLDVEGFGPWTLKAGMHHVEPPENLHADMITLRAHLDAVSANNAPLLVAPGSHRIGRIPQPEIASVVERCGTLAGLAEAGDIWAYSTPILHASDRAAKPARRRVLHVDYAVAELPGGLSWLGV